MKPARGTDEHRAYVVERVRAYLASGGEPTRDGFMRWPGRGIVKNDLSVYGWRALYDEALGLRGAPPPVDVSGLDYEDAGDTVPGAARFESAEPPRQAEPRELLDAQRARAEATEARRQLRDALQEIARADTRAGIVEALRGTPEPMPIIASRERASGLREATLVVLGSDWHIEEVVDPQAIEGRNAYSPEIARARVQRLTDGILWLLDLHRTRFLVRDLVLWFGGDLLSGWIHEELAETNALTPIEATLLLQDLAGGMLRTLLDQGELERIVVPCSYGNHGRTTAKRRHKGGAQTSYEWLVYHHLARTFADEPRVQFQIANGAHLYLPVYDWTVRFHHGDHVNYWGGVGGLTIPVRKALAAWESFRHADLTCMGHFHSYHDFRDFVINGSLPGYSEYALAVKAQYEPAQQASFLIDSRRFKCLSTPIWVTEEPAAAGRAA